MLSMADLLSGLRSKYNSDFLKIILPFGNSSNLHFMSETHPFEAFVPDNSTVLILGSFPGKDQTRNPNKIEYWFYGAKRNQFWKILETVYDKQLNTIESRKNLFSEKGISITDVIRQAKRRKDSNLDQHLYEIEDNKDVIETIIASSKITRVFFTSKFVEKLFQKMFPDYKNGECLPSPSPRYARMTLADKIKIYKSKLPQ
jgi:hypoxanthine-DNA glycosylase